MILAIIVNFVVDIICHRMLILALDTTTRAGSCALARDGRVILEEGSDVSLRPAARLPGDLMALLEHAGVRLDEVDLFAVATGPGSFTGLRIGIATMQGLAFAAGKPLIGVSGFDALAATCRADLYGPTGAPDKARPARVATWVDAWRGEVYAALYEPGAAAPEPVVALPADLLERYDARSGGPDPTAPKASSGQASVRPTGGTGEVITFVGDGAATYRDLILATLGDRARIAEPPAPLIAGVIAQLATRAAEAGELPPPHAIRPLYVRRPDVEIVRDAPPTRDRA